MKAAVVQQKGQPPVYANFAEPTADAGEARVRVAAAALFPLVRARAAGAHYSVSAEPPFVVGVDGVGRLDDGARVYFLLPRAPHGAFAETTVVAATHCLKLPDGLDDATAAALANPGMSSWAALNERAKFVAGETVLVNGATGAAGRLAVQIARRLGARRIIATARNAEALKTVGADVAIPLGGDGAAFERAFAEGVDVVLDYLWGASAERILAAATKAKAPVRFVQIGSASGAEIKLPGAVLRSTPIAIMGSGIGSVPLERLLIGIDALFHAAASEGFALATETVPLANIADAWASTGSGPRIVVTPRGAL